VVNNLPDDTAPWAPAEHAKLRELILYVSGRCFDHHKFGATKLNKILFFADFIAYERFGRSITDEEYFKLQWGPAPRYLKPVRDQLEASQELAIARREVFGFVQERPVPLRTPDLALFRPEEIALVDEIIEALKDKDAEEVSELSHYFVGWKLTREKETIPYHSVYSREMTEDDVTERDVERGREIARRYGLRDPD
jgi:hypothetical protein